MFEHPADRHGVRRRQRIEDARWLALADVLGLAGWGEIPRRLLPLPSGFCYTELTDTCREANGLLSFDWTLKIPLDEIRHSERGDGRDEPLRPAWPAVHAKAAVYHAEPPPEPWAEATA